MSAVFEKVFSGRLACIGRGRGDCQRVFGPLAGVLTKVRREGGYY